MTQPVVMSCFGRFISNKENSAAGQAIFYFCVEADTCLHNSGSTGEATMLHNILKAYVIPGAQDYIGAEIFPLLELAAASTREDPPTSMLKGLFEAALKWLEQHYFEDFLESTEFEDLLTKTEDMSRKDRHPAVASERCVSFSLIKVNERGRKQNRILSFRPSGMENLRGDSVRFSYKAADVESLILHPTDKTSFKLACLHYYDYECESETHRAQVASAFESMGLGRVKPRALQMGMEQGMAEATEQKAVAAPMPKLSDYEVLGVAGKGAYAEVRRVKHRNSGRVYAMKVMKIPHLIQRKQVERVMAEKKILATLSHPFLVRLHSCFIDSNRLCMCLDLAEGGDLFQHLHRTQAARLSPAAAGFYCAEMVCALEYLHNHQVVHRDLKPENILLAKDGHLLLTDFGLSKMDVTSDAGRESQDSQAAFSMVGTKEYVAPEVVLRKAYGKAVDWWAVGILLYELIVGQTPFEGRGGHIFDHIVAGEVHRPRPGSRVAMPDSAWLLIRGLLHVDPEQRFGAHDIREHAFYTEVLKLDWDALEEKDLPPPLRPKPAPMRPKPNQKDSIVASEPTLDPAIAAQFELNRDLDMVVPFQATLAPANPLGEINSVDSMDGMFNYM